MPTAATAGGTRQGTGNDRNAPVAVVPFIRASQEHREPIFDIARALTAADQDLGVQDIPAYGYMRSITLLVTATGGAGAAVTAAEDGPWNAIKNIALTEPNGAVINQWSTGYHLYLSHKWGGYRFAPAADFKASPTFSGVAAATGNFSFMLRIPVELNLRDGLGALPNQNSAASFKLRLGLAASTQIYGTVPGTLPTVRVRAFLEAWDQPEVSTGGQTNQVTPPAMNTTQFWSEQQINVSAGQQTLRLTRVGNYLRNLVFVFRRGGTSRANGHTDMPDPLTFFLDTRPLDIIERNNWLHQMFERTNFGGAIGATVPALDSPRGLDAGVFVYDFAHEFDGSLGQENRDLWLPTLGSSRVEIQGNFANAGVLTVLTNDVAVAGSVFI